MRPITTRLSATLDRRAESSFRWTSSRRGQQRRLRWGLVDAGRTAAIAFGGPDATLHPDPSPTPLAVLLTTILAALALASRRPGPRRCAAAGIPERVLRPVPANALTVRTEGSIRLLPGSRTGSPFPAPVTPARPCSTRRHQRRGHSSCAATSGSLVQPVRRRHRTAASDVDIDHVVALAEAWRSAHGLDHQPPRSRSPTTSTLPQLIAVTDNVNPSKGDQVPAPGSPAAPPTTAPTPGCGSHQVPVGPQPPVRRDPPSSPCSTPADPPRMAELDTDLPCHPDGVMTDRSRDLATSSCAPPRPAAPCTSPSATPAPTSPTPHRQRRRRPRSPRRRALHATLAANSPPAHLSTRHGVVLARRVATSPAPLTGRSVSVEGRASGPALRAAFFHRGAAPVGPVGEAAASGWSPRRRPGLACRPRAGAANSASVGAPPPSRAAERRMPCCGPAVGEGPGRPSGRRGACRTRRRKAVVGSGRGRHRGAPRGGCGSPSARDLRYPGRRTREHDRLAVGVARPPQGAARPAATIHGTVSRTRSRSSSC